MKLKEEKTKEIIDRYYKGTLEIIPGKTKEETREIKIIQILNEVRTKIGQTVKQEFPKDNPLSSMITSGSGGNILNITQMACCVGRSWPGPRSRPGKSAGYPASCSPAFRAAPPRAGPR